MPRRARIDAPGALHHIICRGIEKGKIFLNDEDREDFLNRLAAVLAEGQAACYAWALMPNHFHLLLRTGRLELTKVMQKLLSGYAGSFNRRHRRIGHLFYNRYKSILCQEDAYLLEVTRYIHLNPLRARIVKTLETLDRYPYSGHSVLAGHCARAWQETDKVFGMFGRRKREARVAYIAYVEKGLSAGRRPELTGGGLIRSCGGWEAVKQARKTAIHLRGDERILGDSEFVSAALTARQEALARRYQLEADGVDLAVVIQRVADATGVSLETLKTPGKHPAVVKARSMVCYLAVRELGLTTVAVGRALGICQSAVSKGVERGKTLVERARISCNIK